MELLQNGLNEHIYVKKALFTLCKYFKYRGYDEDDCQKKLITWLSKQSGEYYGSRYYDYSWDDLLKIIKEDVDKVYNNNYKFIDDINIPVTLQEMKEINNLKNKGDKLVAFAMLFFSKLYGDEDKVFYTSYRNLSKLTGISINQIRLIVNKLEECEILKVIDRNKIKKSIKVERGYKVYKQPNKYKLLIRNDKNILYNITDEKNIIKDFWRTYNICIEKYKINVSYRFKKNIKKYVKDEC